jgi:hypothetical protein
MATERVFSEFWQSERKDHVLINNRQAGRRNRGRNNNNGRPNGNNRGGGDNGNRIDNRARGNAAQLLEKYKNMARDAQMAGDRVNAEYYLQFADHYFRVLADNRARQEEQQQRFRPRDDSFDEDVEDFDGGDDGSDDFRADAPPYERAPRDQERRSDDGRDQREARGEGRDNRGRDNRDGGRNTHRDRPRRDRFVAQEMGAEGPAGTPAEASVSPLQPSQAPVVDAAPVEPEADAPRPRRGRPRKAAPVEPAASFDAAVLPPSIGRADNDASPASAAEADAPKKRTRRPRAAATEAAE